MLHPAHFLPAVLQLAALLAIVPTISAIPLESIDDDSLLDTRDIKLPANWTSLGCVTDNTDIPTLTSWIWEDPAKKMTGEACVLNCQEHGLYYAGVENGGTCHCGDILSIIAMNATETDCNVPCPGDSSEMCGAPLRLNLYWSGEYPSIQPSMVEFDNSGAWNRLGCFNDSDSDRVMSNDVTVNITNGQFNMSVDTCTTQCFAQGFTIAGMESAYNCRCGHTLDYPSQVMPSKDCMLPCPGNQSEICGGPDRLAVYFYTGLL